MAQFTDAMGTSWRIELDQQACFRVQKATGITVADPRKLARQFGVLTKPATLLVAIHAAARPVNGPPLDLLDFDAHLNTTTAARDAFTAMLRAICDKHPELAAVVRGAIAQAGSRL